MCQGEKKFVLEHLYQKNFYIKAQRGYFLFVKVKGLNPYWLPSGFFPSLFCPDLSKNPAGQGRDRAARNVVVLVRRRLFTESVPIDLINLISRIPPGKFFKMETELYFSFRYKVSTIFLKLSFSDLEKPQDTDS